MSRYIELECGVHEARTFVSPCPVCSAVQPDSRPVSLRAEALRMYQAGDSFQAIGLALDKSTSHAKSLVRDALGQRRKGWMYTDCISERERKTKP